MRDLVSIKIKPNLSARETTSIDIVLNKTGIIHLEYSKERA